MVNPQPMYMQQELDAKLLAAANALRGPIEPADFKAYILPLLFLKRISDTWSWEYAQALERFDGDVGLAMLAENYRFVVPQPPDKRNASSPTGCTWDDLLALQENVGAGLQLIFDRLQEANPDTLAGVFGTAQWANKAVLPEDRLTAVIDVLTPLRLDPSSVPHDLLGNAYEYLLKYFADSSGTKAGEFFTPRSAVRLLVRMLDPQPAESIYDPTCGSGGMLVEAVNTVIAHGGDPRTLRLYGQEVSATTAAIARMNLYVHDIETFDVKRGDTLQDPRLLTKDGGLQRFNLVVANPPFSIGKETPWGYKAWADDPWDRGRLGLPPKTFADFAFVEHMLESMEPSRGRVATVMSRGVLFRKGERDIRKNILDAGLLEAVVGLPPNIFYGTSLSACALVFRADMPEHRKGHVLFIDASQRYVEATPKNVMTESNVEEVLGVYQDETVADPDRVPARLVSIADIAAKDWNLNIARYVAPPIEAPVPLNEALAAFDSAGEALNLAADEVADRLGRAAFHA